MSARRSPLRTVLRVAELRERGARAAVAAATAAQRAAEHEAQQRLQMVTPLNVALDGARMVAAHEQATMRADAASAAAGVGPGKSSGTRRRAGALVRRGSPTQCNGGIVGPVARRA